MESDPSSPDLSPRNENNHDTVSPPGSQNLSNAPIIKDPAVVYDEYHFPVEEKLVESYKIFEFKHQHRRERLLTTTWKDVKLTRTSDYRIVTDQSSAYR